MAAPKRALKWLGTIHGRVAIAGFLVAAWLIYMLIYAVPDGQQAPPQVPLAPAAPGHSSHWGVWIVGAFIFAWFALALRAAIKLARNDATNFKSLPPEEQARRHEAGRLLHDLGPTPPR